MRSYFHAKRMQSKLPTNVGKKSKTRTNVEPTKIYDWQRPVAKLTAALRAMNLEDSLRRKLLLGYQSIDV